MARERGNGADGLIIALLSIALLACSYAWWRAARQRAAARPSTSGRSGDGEKGKGRGPLPPGSLGLPWVGESLSLLAALKAGDHDRFLRERTARFGSDIFKTVIFNQKTVVLQGPVANRFIAASENKGLLRNSWPPSMLAVVGRGAPIAMHGPEHRRLRHVLLSCLCPAAIQKLVHRAHSLTLCHFATDWPCQLQRHPSSVQLVPLLNLHSFRLACSLLANVIDEQMISRLHLHFRAWLAGMLDLPINFPGTNYRRALLAGAELRREMGTIIDQRCLEQELIQGRTNGASPNDRPAPVDDVLACLLKSTDEGGHFLSRQEMQDVLLFLLFAGHDTTTACLTFTLKFLEQNPTYLDMVVQEQEEIARRKNIPEERLNWADVQSMQYTWRVIQETMRIRPPVIASMKEAMEDLEFDGYHIPKGWKVYLGIGRTHSDEKYFPHATTFDPSRFDADSRESASPPPFAYVPFGVGPHSCLGNEFARMVMCVYLHVLVLHYRWSSLNPMEKVFIRTFPTLAQGYPASVTVRKPLQCDSEAEKTEI